MDSTIPNLVAVTVPALTDLFGVRQSGDIRDKKLTAAQLLSLGGSGDVTKVGTPVNDQIGVWTGDGTLEGVPTLRYNSSLELFADSIVLGDLESVKIRETLVNTIAFRFSNFDRWRMDNDAFLSAASDGAYLKRTGSGLTTPTLVPQSGDVDTGIGSAANDDLSVIAGGVLAIRVSENVGVITMLLGGDTVGTVANAFGLINETASATNPTLLPNRAEEDTGIGQNAADQVSIIGGGVELVRAQEVVGANQFIVSPGGIQDNAALPSLAFGDGDSGFYESFADTIRVSLAGVARWVFTADRLVAHIGNGPSLQNEASTATNPTLIPALGDVSTGIGGITGAMDLIVGGVSGIHLRKAGADIFLEAGAAVHQADVGSAAVPTYSFLLDGNTGMYSDGAGSDVLLFSAGGSERLRLAASINTFTGNWVSVTSSGPGVLDEGASSTNPTLVPNQADPDTGIGRDTVDGLAFIAGGVSCMRVREIAAAPAVGFYTTTPIIKQTGVAVTDVAIHAALVALGLISA